jgi:hypothetical protein
MSDDLAAQVSALFAILERMERRADEDRNEIAHERRNAEMTRSAVSAALADIGHSQLDVSRRLDKIEPVTDLVTSVRSRVTGGLMLLGVIGGIAWAGLVFFKEIIVGWFQ